MTTVVVNPSRDRFVDWIAQSHDEKVLFQGNEAIVRSNPLFEEPQISQFQTGAVFSFGEIKEISAGESTYQDLTRSEICDKTRVFGGSFLQILVYEGACEVITDRFGSVPMFYAISDDSELILSNCYNDVVSELTKAEMGQIQEETIFCFLYLRRLMGDHTYHSNIFAFPAASTTKIDIRSRTCAVERYWAPAPPSISEYGSATELLAERLQNAVERRLQPSNRRNGLMLSGGLDSRALLALGQDRYTCFTNTPSQNNESEIAKQLADKVGARFVYLERPRDYFEEIFSDAITCSNSMTVFYEAQFIGYLKEISKYVDTVHLGLGLDIFFCGHYMNKYHPTIGGRPMLYFKKASLKGSSFEQSYLDGVSYRMKTSNLKDIVRVNQWDDLYESLLQLTKAKCDYGRVQGLTDHALWEYMHLTDFGRHYSMLMANSMKGKIDIRVPALDAGLYDLAFAMSPDLKVNWNVYLAAIQRIDPRLFRIRNANTNIRASLDLHTQTRIQITRGILRKMGFSRLTGLPSAKERSWPLVSEDMSSATMKEKIRHMIYDGKIRNLSFIDSAKLHRVYEEHSCGNANHAVLFGLLLTLEHGLLNVN